ncbi:MAG: PAS domain-containing protein [Hydrococcus sp. RU_2_2]|nr:PAS domain-containing protein [Hydrococcus sp. RU_2_2]
MLELVENFFSSGQFIPHGHCYLWKPGLVWLHLLSDTLIAIAYYSIPIMLVYFVRQRRDVPFSSVFWMFSAFIAACGTTHLMEVWTLWHPVYWLAGTLKATTALISLYTASELFTLIPKALTLPSPEQLELANQKLAEEIEERKQIEAKISNLNEELEKRVVKRTAELEAAKLETENYAQKLVLALDGSKIGAWEWDFATDKLEVTDLYRQIFDHDRTEEITYERWRQRLHPEDLPRTEALLEELLTNKKDYETQYRVIWSDGSLHWINALGRIHCNSEGRPIRMVGIVADISDRKCWEEALYQSEERYRILTEVSPQIVWQSNPDGYITYANRYWFDYTNLTMEETAGDGWVSVIHPDDRLRVLNIWKQAAASDTGYEVEIRFRRVADGMYRWHIARGLPVRDESGKILKWVGIALDIHDRKQAEEALRSSEERLALASYAAQIGTFDWNIQTNETIWSVEEEALYGLPPGGFGGKYENWKQLLHPEDRDRAEQAVFEAVANCTDLNTEFRIVWPDGSVHWIAAKGKVFCDSDGNRLRTIGVNQDITDRKHSELKLKQLNADLEQTTSLLAQQNQELDRFVYIVSHDLKAPLRAIANLSEWIEDDLEGQLPEENKKQMQLLRNRVYRMEALINGLLEYARVGRSEIQEEMVDVGALLEEIVDFIAPPVTFTIVVQPTMPTIMVRRLLLFQVFTNLIGNAIKHHDRPDGRIEISATQKEDYYEFTVSDDGPGIEPEYHEKIFGIFQTLAKSESPDSTGIGLSIVQKIIATEGGEIVLESHLGKGTTFQFTWPRLAKSFFQTTVYSSKAGKNSAIVPVHQTNSF